MFTASSPVLGLSLHCVCKGQPANLGFRAKQTCSDWTQSCAAALGLYHGVMPITLQYACTAQTEWMSM